MKTHTIILIVILIIVSILFTLIENFDIYLGQPTKCFDCEASLPKGLKYLGGRTKCFSCEREMVQRLGGEYGDLGQPTKCFNCESDMIRRMNQ